MRFFGCILLFFLVGCAQKKLSNEQALVSIQLMDRNGVQETISQPERLKKFESVNFLEPQPYEKVTCHYKQNGFSSSKVLSYHKNGQIMQFLEVVSSRAKGAYREFFENGSLKLEAEVIEGVGDLSYVAQESWVFDGVSKVYYENGNLKATVSYAKGVLEGKSTYYRDEGSIWKTTPFISGLMEGEELYFSSAGELVGSVTFVQGQKEGKSWFGPQLDGLTTHEEFSKGKLLEAEYRAIDGELVSRVADGEGIRTIFEKGRLFSTEEISGGIPQGKVSFFHPKGGLEHTIMQKNGVKEGEECFFHPNSKLKLRIIWENDQIHGVVQSWYEEGMVESERMYAGNKKEGTAFAWYKDGSRMLIEEYENDILLSGRYYKKGDQEPVSRVKEGEGIATLYDARGNFLKKISYKKGLPSHE